MRIAATTCGQAPKTSRRNAHARPPRIRLVVVVSGWRGEVPSPHTSPTETKVVLEARKRANPLEGLGFRVDPTSLVFWDKERTLLERLVGTFPSKTHRDTKSFPPPESGYGTPKTRSAGTWDANPSPKLVIIR